MHQYQAIQEKILLLNNQTKAYVDEIKELLKNQNRKLNIPSILGYFTYSLSTTNDEREENIIWGDFQIKNLTEEPIEDLYLCIKIDATDDYKFTGKYQTNKGKKDKTTSTSAWEQFHNQDEDNEHEHWFQLSNQKQLLPQETISFSDFQIKWKNKGFYTCSVQGYAYTAFEKEGIAALNTINVSTNG
ncbi:hypothetical protein [Ornithinibacillus xuwenensis]|uniref:Ig-like domain-containing protein n=1 Tax=Ornithinibacillus xuwenensis TaxID=3144668 RepID=A0ABU9XIG6_9BACI